jgi:hypothetical protein
MPTRLIAFDLHRFSVEADGNFYRAERFRGRTQNRLRQAGADRSKVGGAPAPSSKASQ